MEEQSFREFIISGLSDREAIKLSGACQRREAPMPGQRRAGKLVINKRVVNMSGVKKDHGGVEEEREEDRG